MKLEQQAVSLELAQKLKELGVDQNSVFYWSLKEDVQTNGTNSDETSYKIRSKNWNLIRKEEFTIQTIEGWYKQELCSAFTVAELGEMLPKSIEKSYPGEEKKYTYYLSIWYSEQDIKWYVGYEDLTGIPCREESDTEADARAKTLIYLIENGLLKA